jgi:predicted DNA-binding protein
MRYSVIRGEKMSTAMSVRLPDEVALELEELSETLDRPKTYIIVKALERYLEEYADHMVALERLRDKDDKVISGREMRERLGI